jgi:hypothetical protein
VPDPRPPVRAVRALLVTSDDPAFIHLAELRRRVELLFTELSSTGVDIKWLEVSNRATAERRIRDFLEEERSEDELALLYLGGDALDGPGGSPVFVLANTDPQALAETGLDLRTVRPWMRGEGRYALILDFPHADRAVNDLRQSGVAVLAWTLDEVTHPIWGPLGLTSTLATGLSTGDADIGRDGVFDLAEAFEYLRDAGAPNAFTLWADDDPADYVIGWNLIRRGAVPPPVASLPPPANVFVGRERELATVVNQLIDRRARPPVVAIVGPGGIGKTQLAVRAARAAQGYYDAVHYLSADHGFAEAMAGFAQVLRLRRPGGKVDVGLVLDSIGRRLGDDRVLFVVDDLDAADSDLYPEQLLQALPPKSGILLVGHQPFRGLSDRTVTLGGLSADEISELLQQLGARDEPIDAGLLDMLDGSPLLTRLTARSIADGTFGEGGGSLRVVVERSYRRLGDGPAALFRRASAVPAALVGDGMDAELAEVLVEGGAEYFGALRDVGLFTELVDGRMDFAHPVVREFAAGRFGDDEEQDEREVVERRVRGWLLGHTHHQPEPRIARDYWTVDDRLDYAPYADAIAAFIRHRDTAPPLTIGVKAQWGEGKTSLMRMVQHRLDPPVADGEPARIHLTQKSRTGLKRRATEPDPERRVSTREVLDRAAGSPDPVRDLEAAPAEETGPGAGWRATVWFNPWMYQSSEQVWAGMAHEIIRQVTERLSIGDRERFWLELNLSRLDTEAVRRRAYGILWRRVLPLLVVAGLVVTLPLLGLVASGYAGWARYLAGSGVIGAAVVAFGGGAVRWMRFRAEDAAGPFAKLVSDPDRLMPDPGYGDRLGFLHLVHDDIRKVLRLVATEDSPLVVFVDDLDRCSPGTVAQVIEAINLFLAGEFPNCIFVLAMEPALVAAHVEVTYKELVAALREGHAPAGEWITLGWRFLEKIVQLPLSLPKTQPAGEVTRYVRSLLDMDGRPAIPRQPSPTQPAPVADTTGGPVASPAPAPQPAVTVDLALVRRIAEALVVRGPTVTTLPDLAREVQAELRPDAGEEPLLPETVRAVERVFGDLYSDADAADAMEAALPALASANPREIKRYINLFRFYTFIVQRQRLQGVPAPSGDSIAKLAALAIRWPHLLPALSRDGSVICGLERATRGDDTWEATVEAAGLLPEHGTNELRTFLHIGPEIGGVAARLL